MIIMLLHFIGDFVLQNRWIANKKSTNNWVLAIHCLIYSLVVWGGMSWLNNKYDVITLFLVFWSHFGVDYFTSRMTSYFYLRKNHYGFFTTIGLDQYLHFLCLYYLIGV